jgi:hypothetical protein
MLMVITHGSGQLGNRLIQFGNLLAYAMEHGHCLLNLGLTEYQSLFEQFHQRALITYPSVALRLPTPWLKTRYAIDERLRRSLMAASGRLPFKQWMVDYELPYLKLGSLEDIEESLAYAKILTLRGLKFQHPELVEKHGDRIRSLLALRDVGVPRSTGKMVIGLHIRHGDYRIWRKGQFFFTIAQYRAVLERLLAQIIGDVIVRIYSNAAVELELFKGLPVELGAGDIAGDLQSMSHCDLLLGPPSSFSLWASFIGQVPLYFIEQDDVNPAVADFQVNTNLKYLY